MDTTDWLIVAAVAGPVAGALLSPFTGAAVLQLARVRARRVQHVAASGADLMRNGVPQHPTNPNERDRAGQTGESRPLARRGSRRAVPDCHTMTSAAPPLRMTRARRLPAVPLTAGDHYGRGVAIGHDEDSRHDPAHE